MLYYVGHPLPEYRVKASIDCVHSAEAHNQIHDDDFAKHHGFRSGLVSGASLFAYMSRPVAELLGRDWLARGSAEVRFVRPVYEGEEIRVTGSVVSIAKDGTITMECQAANNLGAVCGIGIMRHPSSVPVVEPSASDYPDGNGAFHRPISLETLEKGEPLRLITSECTRSVNWQYCRKSIRDHHPLYETNIHPGWLVNRASRILSANFAIPAWIDVSSQIQNFRTIENECRVETRGRVRDRFELKGDHFVVLELALFVPQGCLATILYTAIFRIAPNAA
ncbi:MAG: MaoC family dehydratase [Acidobacteria bacterium]|nr:MaoC family dehydratase [Acidobacteriota bacterium]